MTQSFITETQKWRDEQESRLRSDEGWLTVVGLDWLREGENSVGSGEESAVLLPQDTPSQLGRIYQRGPKVSIIFNPVEGANDLAKNNVTIDGQPAKAQKEYALRDDQAKSGATIIKVGSVTFYLLKRPNGFGIRVKDTNAEARKKFNGRKWFAPDQSYLVKAQWTELTSPKKLEVPDILGNTVEENSPGFASFEIDGEKALLFPTKDGDKLFFVFKDKTSGKETYGAARFLYASAPVGREMTLDFNRAVNPPCAFTAYATCPLPPPENRLKVAIRAGELTPDDAP